MGNGNDTYVFGLDIGTRSIVGTVGYRIGTDRFVVMAQVSIEHKTRAVIDGQIHDIPTVVRTIKEVKARLEEKTGEKLSDVSIAAAGRVLKTKNVYVEYEMPSESKVTSEHVHSLDNVAVEKAYEEIRLEADHKDKHFYCVGYSPVKYYLNGYPMEMIEEHMAASIGVEMIATFLPDEVVEGLYAAVEQAGLHVASLTLEPIAAINIAIPERFRLLNIALVDVGAGTSDISIVKDGSIIAFGMMPLAGDEITEAIAKKYLVDFETAEKIKRGATKRKSISFKNIMGEAFKLDQKAIQDTAKEAMSYIVEKVSDKIVELNGGNPVSAVFVVGGGGKMPGFTELMAERIGLPKNRVSIRGAEVLRQIDFSGTGVKKDSTLVTPIGICLEYYEQKNSFIHVRVNEERVKLYDNGKATILDACIHAGFSQDSLFPSRGDGITYTLNGEKKELKGRLGEAAEVVRQGKESNLNELVADNDVITVKPATKGEDASLTVGKLPECKEELKYTFLGRTVLCPKVVKVNKEQQSEFYEIRDGDSVVVQDTYSAGQLFEFMGVEPEKDILVDGEKAELDTHLENGAAVEYDIPPEPEKPPEPPKPEKPAGKSQTAAASGTDGSKAGTGGNITAGLSGYSEPAGPDPLLSPVKPLPAWAADLPISNPSVRTYPNMPAGGGMGMPQMAAPNMAAASGASWAAPSPAPAPVFGHSISVEVNGQKVTIPAKDRHTFVDVFDAYPIDLTKSGGKRLVSRLNGMDVMDFTTPLHDKDSVDLYWEK